MIIVGNVLLLKDKIDRAYQQEKGGDVIPPKGKILEEDERKGSKDHQGDHFLDDLELQEIEGTALPLEADAIGRHLETILKEGNTPAQENDGEHGRMPCAVLPEKTQMPVPGHRHKGVGKGQEADGKKNRFHLVCFAAK